MLLRCEQLTAEVIEGFVANAPNKTKLSQGINQSFVLVAAMVKAHPCLKIDFQVFLRNDGAVLNVDLDRCDEYSIRGFCVNPSTMNRSLNWKTSQASAKDPQTLVKQISTRRSNSFTSVSASSV